MITEAEDDHESALKALEKIESSNRRIMDDEAGETVKRSLTEEEVSQPASKKMKKDDGTHTQEKEEELNKRKLHKTLKRLSRNELEEIIGTKMVEVITQRSEIGKLRQKVDSYEETIAKWKQRAQALSKQCTDLGTVMKKYITDSKNKPGEKVAPVRITRSVGLQVVSQERKLQHLQQQKQDQQARLQLAGAGARIATRPATARLPPGSLVTNGAVRKSVARPANGVLRHPSGVEAVPISSAVRQAVKTTSATVFAMASIKKSGVTITPQSRLMSPVSRPVTQPTLAPTPTPTASMKKKVIDVVDLSDEDEPSRPPMVKITPVKAAPPPVRAQVRPAGLPVQRGRPVMPTSTQPRPRTVLRKTVGALAPRLTHPASLPSLPARQPMGPGLKQLPPKPSLKIQRAPNEKNGIILSWTLNHNPAIHATITAYQLYAYQVCYQLRKIFLNPKLKYFHQETAARPDSSLWKRVGDSDVKAMPLPMACTLTQFTRSVVY